MKRAGRGKLSLWRSTCLLPALVLALAGCGQSYSPPTATPNRPTGSEPGIRTQLPTSTAALPQASLAQASAGKDSSSRDLSQRDPRYDTLRFEHLSLDQGLSQSTVSSILQDRLGFMWFGTEEGLNRYDGYRITVYKHDPEDPSSLSNNWITALYEDSTGELWIGTQGGGMDRYDRETNGFVHFQYSPDDPASLGSNSIRAITEDRTGMLWIGTEAGLSRYNRETGRFFNYRDEPLAPEVLRSGLVTAIYEGSSGLLWFGTDEGIVKYDAASRSLVQYIYQEDKKQSVRYSAITSLYEDKDGTLWVGTLGGGVSLMDRSGLQLVHFTADERSSGALSSDAVRTIYQDRAGDIWVGTEGGGLNRFDRSNWRFTHFSSEPDNPNSLSNNFVRSIYEGQDGILWVGTWGGGVNLFDRGSKKFLHYRNQSGDANSLASNLVWSIYQDRSGILWIGTLNGLDRLSPVRRQEHITYQFTHYQYNPEDPTSISPDGVRAILRDQRGILWVGTEGGGLNRMEPEGEGFFHYRHDPANALSLGSDVIFAITEGEEGELWLATQDGLDRFNRGMQTFTHYRYDPADPDSLSHNEVWAVTRDHSGDFWVGTRSGLNHFDPQSGKFTRYWNDADNPDSLSDNRVLSIYEDRQNILWVGTMGGGLNRLDPATGKFKAFRDQDGLPNNTVYGILEDRMGFLWLSTNNGLSRFNPQTGTFKNFDVNDGLQSNGFNQGSSFQSKSGEMFFGGVNGFNTFYPENIIDKPYVPPIVLTALTRGGEPLLPDKPAEIIDEVNLNWPANDFEFEVAALSYSQPEKNQYAYMLENFDTKWNYFGPNRFGRYTNLPGGTYTLRLIGSNSDGIWNEKGARIRIQVVPPFWATWWFRGGLILAGGLGILAGYRLRLRRVESRSRELSVLVEERTHEIERRRQELEVLYHADEVLYRNLHVDQVLQALVDTAVDILHAGRGALLVWDEQQGKYLPRAAHGFSDEELCSLSFDDGPKNIHLDRERSSVQVPIIVGGETFGVFRMDWFERSSLGEEERLLASLADRAALAVGNAQLYEKTQARAVVEERSRLARELHDAVTQTLFSASLIAEALPTSWENDAVEGRQLLGELRQLSRGALAEMRTLLLELRPATLVEARLEDLLRQLGEAVTGREGIHVSVAVEGRFELPPDVHVAFYRITQEALNNVVKHARAGNVTIHLRPLNPPGDGNRESMPPNAVLTIGDDGRGFDPERAQPDRMGLAIMRERAQAIGATLAVESLPGRGTQISVLWER